MAYSAKSIGQDLLNVPMGDMIREMAFSIAEAQVKLDENSIEVAQMMGGLKSVENNGVVTFEDSRVFFGRETVTLENAITIYNSTSDDDLKGIIEAEHFTKAPNNVNVTKTSGKYSIASGKDGSKDNELTIPTRLSMMELGFTPTFYQFVDTIIEVKLSISFTQEHSSETKVESKSRTVSKSASIGFSKGRFSASKRKTVTTTQVNGTYASKFNYTAEGSSLLRTKLTPVPPPAILEERIRIQLDALRKDNEPA